jgi:hypothetical protein
MDGAQRMVENTDHKAVLIRMKKSNHRGFTWNSAPQPL